MGVDLVFYDDFEPIHFGDDDIDADCPSARGNFLCTGPTGHSGRHYADGIERCHASWTDES